MKITLSIATMQTPLPFEGKRGDMRRRRQTRARKKDSYESSKAMREAKKSLEQEQLRYENAQKAAAKTAVKTRVKALTMAVAFIAPMLNFAFYGGSQGDNHARVHAETFDKKPLSGEPAQRSSSSVEPVVELLDTQDLTNTQAIVRKTSSVHSEQLAHSQILPVASIGASYALVTKTQDSLDKLLLDPSAKQAFFEFSTANLKASKQLGEPLIPYIEKVCKEYGPDVDPRAVLAIIFNESCGDNTLVDARGAVGFMQLEAITIKDIYLHFEGLEKLDPHKPKDNIKLGVLALQNWINQSGSVRDGYKGYSGRSNYSYYERVMRQVEQMNKYPEIFQAMRNGRIKPVNDGCSIALN